MVVVDFTEDGQVRVTRGSGPRELVPASGFEALVADLASRRAVAVLHPRDAAFLRLRVLLAERSVDVAYDASAATP
jgi:hypothetical protein